LTSGVAPREQQDGDGEQEHDHDRGYGCGRCGVSIRALDRAGFDTCASALRAAHRGKSSLMRRFDDAGSPNP
jgi:hypothetical protein